MTAEQRYVDGCIGSEPLTPQLAQHTGDGHGLHPRCQTRGSGQFSEEDRFRIGFSQFVYYRTYWVGSALISNGRGSGLANWHHTELGVTR